MHSHRKLLCAPALRQVLLALVATCWAGASAGTLGILGTLAGCRTAEPARLKADDATITSTIKARLANDGDLSPFNITVTTNEGVVTLRGRVNSADTREKAERYARETDGVVRVIDQVKVGDLR